MHRSGGLSLDLEVITLIELKSLVLQYFNFKRLFTSLHSFMGLLLCQLVIGCAVCELVINCYVQMQNVSVFVMCSYIKIGKLYFDIACFCVFLIFSSVFSTLHYMMMMVVANLFMTSTATQRLCQHIWLVPSTTYLWSYHHSLAL